MAKFDIFQECKTGLMFKKMLSPNIYTKSTQNGLKT